MLIKNHVGYFKITRVLLAQLSQIALIRINISCSITEQTCNLIRVLRLYFPVLVALMSHLDLLEFEPIDTLFLFLLSTHMSPQGTLHLQGRKCVYNG